MARPEVLGSDRPLRGILSRSRAEQIHEAAAGELAHVEAGMSRPSRTRRRLEQMLRRSSTFGALDLVVVSVPEPARRPCPGGIGHVPQAVTGMKSLLQTRQSRPVDLEPGLV